MRSAYPGFATVRVVCYRCGWSRILGPTGTSGTDRILMRIERARSSCNVLWSKVITVPRDQHLAIVTHKYPNYHDLEYECDSLRNGDSELYAAKVRCWNLTKDQPCPRCKQVGKVCVEVFRELSNGGSLHVPFELYSARAGIKKKTKVAD